MYLPDINLWLALVFDSHFHHRAAKAWFDTVPDGSCHFCRMTQQGFLRLATNPRAFPDDAVSLSDAWGLYDALLGDARVSLSEEPAGIEAAWRMHTQGRDFSPKVWNDAYLAAFAQTAALALVTFDRAMTRYEGPRCTVLS